MKIAGSYFLKDSDRKESVIEFTLDDDEKNEVTIATQDADVQVCVDIEDLERIVKKLVEEKNQ